MFVPSAFDDELLFGRVIRYFCLSGESSSQFAENILVSSRHTFHPTLTAGISNLSILLGDSETKLLYEQTLAPLYFFFSPRYLHKLRKLLLNNDGNKALWESQLASFKQGGTVCLKWCHQCAVEDIFNHGVAYWHRSHQIFGISACYKHNTLLQVTRLGSRQKLERGLFPLLTNPPESPALEVEVKVAKFSSGLLKILSKKMRPFNWLQAYRNRLDELGYITRGNQIRRQLLFKDFFDYAHSLVDYGDNPLPKHGRDYRYLSELLVSMSAHHPFRHLLFGSWLFDRAEEFFDYESVEKSTITQEVAGKNKDVEHLCLSLLKQGESMAEVYRVTGKSRCYLKRLALLNGVPINLKPRVLTDNIKARIIKLSMLSMHRKRICEICGVGIGSVEQVISGESGLVEWRTRCHFESKRRRCRLELLRYVAANPLLLRQNIKSKCNAAFFWLYHHDNKWLEGILPQATKPIGFGKHL
ncbi:TnsD family Tn7-like transposition protein [Vibrio chagasii]|uniref:TnsD family Tn7-like transposition protein n=1 Tax=Vibrio chagasii TaxID=170679 RepID=UPI003DA0B2F3